MQRFARFGKIVGWLASVCIALYALAIFAVAATYFSACDLPDWGETIGTFAGYAVAAVAANPLAWRFPLFGTVSRRLIVAFVGLAVAFVLPTTDSDPPHLQGDCSQNV